MVGFQACEHFLIDLLHHHLVLSDYPVACDGLDHASGEQLPQGGVRRLVVNDPTLVRRAFLGCKLAAHTAVADGNLRRGQREDARSPDDLHSDRHHNRVKDTRVPFQREFSVTGDIDQSHHHIGAGDSDVVKASPSVVLASIADLGAQVATLNTWLDLPGLRVPDVDHERLNAEIVLIDDQPGENHSVTAEHSQVSGPVLGRCDCGRVDDELVCLAIEGRCGLKASNVGAMANLSLSITANDVHILHQRNPVSLLLLVGKVLYSCAEH